MQVYCNDHLVGHLNIDRRSLHGDRYFMVLHDMVEAAIGDNDYDLTASMSARRLELPIRRRSFALSDEVLVLARDPDEILRLARERHHIPDDADQNKDLNRMVTVFSWKVFDVMPADYEQLFDLSEFVPV